MEYQNKAVAFDKLTVSSANVRHVAKGKGIERLAEDIAKNGLIQPLTVSKSGDCFEVDAGFRRFSALAILVARGDWTGPVPCRVIAASASIIDRKVISLSENDHQLPMHPLDRARVLAGFVRKGMSAATVASRFSLDVKEVERVLRLERLALPIRAALIKGELAEDLAFAYAETLDRTTQLEVFERQGHWWKASDVRRALNGKDTGQRLPMKTTHRLFRAFGDAYMAAGGTIEADLFTAEGEGRVDGAIMRRIAEAELTRLAEEKREADGLAWSHVVLNHDEIGDGFVTWRDANTPCPVSQGVGVYVDFRGSIQFVDGLIRSEEWDAFEQARRDMFREEEAAEFDADPDEDDDAQSDDDAQDDDDAQNADEVSRAPSRPMNRDAEAALTVAMGFAMQENFPVAFDTFLHSVLTDLRGGYTALAFRPQLSGGCGLPDDFKDTVLRAQSVWALIDGWSEAEKQSAFAMVLGAMARANSEGYAIDRPAPQAAAVECAKRLGVNMHDDWEDEDRAEYLARMTKHDLAYAVRGLTGEAAADAVKLPSDAAQEKAMKARWVPAYFADVAGGPVETDEANEADEADETDEADDNAAEFAIAAE